MGRTVDDYDSMAKREIIKAKQEKAMMCVIRLVARVILLNLRCCMPCFAIRSPVVPQARPEVQIRLRGPAVSV